MKNITPTTSELVTKITQSGEPLCFQSLLINAIFTLELALQAAPCTGPECDIWNAIENLKQHL